MADVSSDAENETTEPEAEDGDELFGKLTSWFKADKHHSTDWRKDAHEDYDFVAGNQWNTDDRAFLEEQKRPVVTFNRIGATLDSVCGLEVNNRQEVRYIPREQGDVGVNEVLTGAGEWARDECDAEDEESDAFQDAVTCGMGWTETRPDYLDEPEGQIIVDRIDPLEMVWDRGAKKKNLADRRRHFHVKKMPREDAEEMFPDAEADDLHAKWAGLEFDDKAEPHDATPERAYNQGDQGDGKSTRTEVNIVYCEWWETEKFHRILAVMPGQPPLRKDVDEKQYNQYRKRVEQAQQAGIPIQFQAVPGKRRVYKEAFLGAKVLKSGPGRCATGFSYNCITGKRDRNAGTWYGLVRVMKDPQRWANKFFSTALHDLNTGGKGIIAEADAFENWRDAEENWTAPDAITKANPGAISGGKIMPKPSPTKQAQIAPLMEYAISSIRDVSGINLEMLGLADREQAGVLEYQRKQAGMTILATLFDSLRRYRKIQGRVMLYCIQTYIPEGTLVRLTGPQGARYVPLAKQSDTAKYDVIVDEASTSPNLKERTWAVLQPMMPVIAKLGLPPQMWAEILKYSPLPESLTEKLSQMLQQGAQQQVPPEIQMHIEEMTKQLQQMQQELAKTKEQNSQLKLDKQADMVDAMTNAKVKEQEMLLKQRQAELEAAIKVQELEIEKAKAAHDMWATAAKAQQEQEIGNQRMGIEKAKADHSINTEERKAKAQVAMPEMHNEQMTQFLSGLGEIAKSMTNAAETMNKPKRILRDAKGKATGVETVH